jgi:hypothetical protein
MLLEKVVHKGLGTLELICAWQYARLLSKSVLGQQDVVLGLDSNVLEELRSAAKWAAIDDDESFAIARRGNEATEMCTNAR